MDCSSHGISSASGFSGGQDENVVDIELGKSVHNVPSELSAGANESFAQHTIAIIHNAVEIQHVPCDIGCHQIVGDVEIVAQFEALDVAGGLLNLVCVLKARFRCFSGSGSRTKTTHPP